MNSNDNISSLKSELIRKLSEETTDISEILTLSTKLSNLDQDTVRFTVDADHVSRLGLELVAKKETALSEIVKNSYDADADTVLVNFHTEENKTWIEVIDNGSGMSREELIKGFMRISTSLKKNTEYSEIYHRRRAGKKGIGRFAAQRLGLKLAVITKRVSDDSCLRVDIDWREFESEKELISISSKIREESCSKFAQHEFYSGTILIIENLRDEWTDSQIKRAYRYTSALLLPFPLSQNSAISGDHLGPNAEKIIDPGFNVVMTRAMDLNREVIVDHNEMFLKHSLAEINGWIDESGKGHWRVSSKYLKYDSGVKNYSTKTLTQYLERDSRGNDELNFSDIKNVRFKAYYFNQGVAHVPKLLSSPIFENLREHGGIRLYRNGFRVLPYGENYDDWLRLDRHTKNRTILPPMANQNFFGVVEIHSDTEGYFEEVASREGLLETDSFNELREFVSSSILSAIVDFSYALGGSKVFSTEKDYVKKPRPTFQNTIEELSDSIEQLEDTANLEIEVSQNRPSLFSENNVDQTPPNQSKVVSKKLIEDIARQTRTLINKAEIYRILAGLGLSMAEFTHEVKFSILKVSNNIARINEQFSSEPIGVDLAGLKSSVDNLSAYTSFFEKSFQSLNDQVGDLLDLRRLVTEFFNALEDTKHEDDQIDIQLSLKGVDFVSRKAHRANFDSVLVNLYSNAKKAIYKKGCEGRILIELEELKDTVEMVFSDDGCGILKENQEKVFEEFYTTSSQVYGSPESQQMLGMGLGLTIVKEIVEGLDGEIYITSPPAGFATSFRVVLPKADEKDIEDDF